jgi:hypothetical protein
MGSFKAALADILTLSLGTGPPLNELEDLEDLEGLEAAGLLRVAGSRVLRRDVPKLGGTKSSSSLSLRGS